MESNHNHIYREQKEVQRLMQNFGKTPAPETRSKIEQMLEGQRGTFLEIEKERHREQSRGRGR